MLRVRHAVFDFDGTLVDSNRVKRDGFLAIAARHPDGVECMHRILDDEPGDRSAKIAAYVARMRATSAEFTGDVDMLLETYSAAVDSEVVNAAEMADAQPLLKALRDGGVACYLSSATPISNLRRIIERRSWANYFDGVFGHPDSKEQTLERLIRCNGGDPMEFAVIGDGEDDRASAKAVGCRFFSVGEGRGRDREEPVYSLGELAAILLD